MNRSHLYAAAALGCWFGIAVAAAHFGLLLHVAPPLVIAPLIIALLAALALLPALRSWLRARLLLIVHFHVIRLIGFAFLVLYRDARLPFDFAIPAGFGDIAVAIFALFVGLYVDAAKRVTSQRMLLVWNVLGLADLINALRIGTHLAAVKPESMLPLRELPMSLVPTFLVPLLVASHVLIFTWAWSERHLSREHGESKRSV